MESWMVNKCVRLVKLCANEFGVDEFDIYSRCRVSDVAHARWAIAVVMYYNYGLKPREISDFLGQHKEYIKDASRRHFVYMKHNPPYRNRFEALTISIKNEELHY